MAEKLNPNESVPSDQVSLHEQARQCDDCDVTTHHNELVLEYWARPLDASQSYHTCPAKPPLPSLLVPHFSRHCNQLVVTIVCEETIIK